MPPQTLALYVLGLFVGVLAYFGKQTLAEVRDIGRRMDKVHQTVFGPDGNNGLNSDAQAAKAHASRVEAFITTICLLVGMIRAADGSVSFNTDQSPSPLERRFAERRHGSGRRADDGPPSPSGSR